MRILPRKRSDEAWAPSWQVSPSIITRHMETTIMSTITLNSFLNPVSPISAKRRETITQKLEDEGITRLTIERGNEHQSLRYENGGWKLTALRTSY